MADCNTVQSGWYIALYHSLLLYPSNALLTLYVCVWVCVCVPVCMCACVCIPMAWNY